MGGVDRWYNGSMHTLRVTLPPVFQIDTKENGNTIRQLAVPGWSGESTVKPYSKKKLRGILVTPSNGDQSILVITNSAKPNADYSQIIRVVDVGYEVSSDESLDLSLGKWVRHPALPPRLVDQTDYERNVASTRDSWRGTFSHKREDVERSIQGLRPPQIGAIYGVQSHWTVNRDPATVVLPTGVGKTETMLSLLIAERCERLMVVVPTDALRTQIAEKFISLGLLKTVQFQVVSETARYPVVGSLSHRPIDVSSVDSFFKKCNVIVSTMPLASQCAPEIMARMAEHCSYLFIDEAHHVAAPKWREFKNTFKNSRIVQFTATPFRNDDRPIDGKRVFTFSLRNAQEQNYFKPIHFKPVYEFDPDRKDIAIAEAAVAQLRDEAELGHILMARVSSVARAAEVFDCYKAYSEFNPVQIHTGVSSKAERDEIRRKLISGESKIVVCVDMLGEGFDLPELKIAAFHDIRKSLSVTLQLAGRFTRTKPNLGNATFIANVADIEVKDELKRLYQHDADWNLLLPVLSEGATDGDFNLGEFLGGFKDLPDQLTLRNVRPAMSTVVYRTKCEVWTPENFADGIPGFEKLDREYHTLNRQGNTLVVVTTRRIPVEWAQIDEIHTWDWQLHVLYWDEDQKLLFIHNSNNAGYFKRLAQAVAGDDVEQILGPNIFRCIAGVRRFKFQNVGLREQLGRLIRYTMRSGSDVEHGMSEAQKQKTIKSNVFGQGFENGHRTTIGCSYKGRIWSFRTTNLLELTRWCRAIGEKLVDETLDPDEVLKGTLTTKLIGERPRKTPIAVDWPELFYTQPEKRFSFAIGGHDIYPHNASILLVNPSDDGPLAFVVKSEVASATFELNLVGQGDAVDYSIKRTNGSDAIIRYQSRESSLQDFFGEYPPTFWFADGSSLLGNEYAELPRQPDPFPRNRIEAWNWTGTNIRVESQGVDRISSSIQFRVIQEVRKRNAVVVFDDDDSGESADVVVIFEHEDRIEVEFWHCKFSMDDRAGYRIKDLYEVCGQAQKSVHWLEKPRDLFTHLMRRDPRRNKGRESTRYESGCEKDLLRIREKSECMRTTLSVFVVQPGLSKSGASHDQLALLAVTENYLMETFAVSFGVVASD